MSDSHSQIFSDIRHRLNAIRDGVDVPSHEAHIQPEAQPDYGAFTEDGHSQTPEHLITHGGVISVADVLGVSHIADVKGGATQNDQTVGPEPASDGHPFKGAR